jgi:exosortase E/protease (VPEID-CTERM system)
MTSVMEAEGLRTGGASGLLANRLFRRLAWLAALLAAEWIPISAWVSTGRGGQSAARALVTFIFFLFTFGYFKVQGKVSQISPEIEVAPVSWGFLSAHIGSMAVFLGLSLIPAGKGGPWEPALLACWYGTGILGLVLAALAFVPPCEWLGLLRKTGHVWVFAVVAAAVAWRFVLPSWSVWDGSLWKPAIDATFNLTRVLLQPFLSDLVTDRAALVMGSSRFAVSIGGACSGFEGAGLMLVFSITWLWFFRRECRFPQALVLIPASIAVMWLLNAVRIAVLILIGNAGFPGIAVNGFHSQAGWISFNLVAVSVSLAAGRVPWWRNRQAEPPYARTAENPTARYLVPFLAILAAAMISRAASSGFEWPYPLRLLAAAGALWFFRSQYTSLNWRVSWFAPVTGVAVFILWMALERGAHADNGFASSLASSSAFARTAWLVCRSLAAVITVPIAEELAFRGFLIRRLMAADFESLDFRSFSYFAVLVSSLAFGLLHGDRWFAGTIAGILYAIAFLRRGSIGDAAVAHATTNALLAAVVLIGGNWYLW